MNFRTLFFIRRCLVPVVLAFVLPRSFAMDMARVETRVDDAVARFGVTGKGVLVAVMDRGIDWANNDFRNADGTTRIKYIFDLTDNTGASDPNNIYGYGTIYTEDDINSALTGGPPLATRDAIGHGTTTAGIACGNGRNSLDAQYRGVATNATLIVVKLVSDGAPAHDGQPAEAPFYDPSLIPVAIQFVKDKAGELGMPCVMLMNFGSQEGPTDGTSALCQTIDSTVGPGKTGLVFLTGAGDDGGMANRAGGQIVQGGTNTLQIQKGEAGPLVLNLWYGGADSVEVLIQTPDNVDGPFPALADNNDYFSYSDAEIAFYHYRCKCKLLRLHQRAPPDVSRTGRAGGNLQRGPDWRCHRERPFRRNIESVADLEQQRRQLFPQRRCSWQHLGRGDRGVQHLRGRLCHSHELHGH